MTAKKTICLAMIVKNEAHLIVDTLKHLDKYIKFDFWVINDNGSTDGTQKLIQDFFADKKIPGILDTTPWQDFAYNRTVAFNVAYNKTDYVFVWDADDEIYGDFVLPAELTEDSYKFIFGSGSEFRYSRCQMFNNRQRWCYKGVLHEYADCLEPTKPSFDVLGNYYFVSGRKGDRSKDPQKYLKDAMVLRREIEKPDGDKNPLYNRYMFYCAQSYNSCGMREEAIEFYKKTLHLQTWVQEKYVSCLEIFDQYEHLGKPEEGLRFLVESHKYDPTRVECVYRLVKHYCINGQADVAYAYYTLIQDFFENKYDPGLLGDKLFAKMVEYHFYLPYYMVIAAERANKLETAAKMYDIIIKLGYVAPEWWMRNIMFNLQFCMSHLPKTVPFLQGFLRYLDLCRSQGIRFESAQLQVLGRMIDLYRPVLMARPEVSAMPLKKSLDGSPVRVMLTMTSCKRFDLFEQTVGSLLNTWKDLNKVDYFFCVDDNSSQRDRTKMTSTFPFFDYYMKRKSEKGHRASMNIIYDKLKEVNPTYWIHMEDDWLFFQTDNYVQKSIDFLEKYEKREIHQILYNRHYGETYDCWDTNGGTPLEPGYLLHLKSDAIPGRNCGYWPHYSFRPSMIRTKVILELGNYDSANTFFERDYADKYFAKGYLSAFFNTICSLHIGKLTSDKKGTNAYTLNETGQFGAKTTKANSTYVVNLLRRTDRKEATEVMLEKAGFQENEYEFFEAVDGKNLILTDEINQLFLGNDFGSRRGFIGCAMSHYALWKQLLDDKDNEYYTILEDDNTVADDFKAKLESVKADLVSKDIVFLGYTTRDPHIRNTIMETPAVALDLSKYVGGTFGYVITKSGAQILVDYIAKHGIKHGIDYLMKITPNMRYYSVQPHIVFSEWIMSDAKQGDSDIQIDQSSLPITIKLNKDDWVFYEGVDSGGGDIGRISNSNIDNIMKEAQYKTGCAGFNTLGYLKSHIRFPLIKSPWLTSPGGIYIKKSYKPLTRIKMLCNWCSSHDLCKEWLKMTKGSYQWNDIEITWTDDNIDYYVIINKPRAGDKYEANKTIIFHMEPWCSDPQQNWGVKSWGEWAKPDPAKFLQVRSHDKFLNTAFWQVSWTYTDFKTREINKSTDLQGIVSSICSSKYYDPGHKKRIDFLKYIESRMAEKDAVKVHVFNEDNEHGFATYQGKARPFVDKEKGLMPYKYYFMCENNAETNFVTEKLWEPILCEALCFYWGCPNVADHVDPMAYVVLDMNDFEAAYNTMNAAIKMNLWEERLPYIKAAKQRILEEQGFFPVLEQALKPKTVCFVHSCHLAEAGTEKLDIILESVCTVKELECITINNIGLPLDADKYMRLDARIKVIESSCDTSLFELPTLKLISDYSKANPKAKVLYVHTKGISYAKNDHRYINGIDWINYMLYFLCKRADKAIKLLDTHDVAGCNYSDQPYPHFSGNFWWATSEYLKSISVDFLVDKMSAEWWLMRGSGPVKIAKLWSSDKNHFVEGYPLEKYNMPKSLVVYTYFASLPSDYNLNYYSKMAITESANVDYIIVVNGNTCNVTLPKLPNLKVIYRDNIGFDFGGHKAALDSLYGKQYDYYFFMNSGTLGPFLPDTHPKDIHWTELFINKITDKVKLVSLSIFPSPDNVSSEAYFFMTDRIGLDLLITKMPLFYSCSSKYDAIGSENALSRCILNNGYTIDCMLNKFKGIDWLDKKNWNITNGRPPSRKNAYFGESINPFETIFHKWYWENPLDSMVSYDIVDAHVKKFIKMPEKMQTQSDISIKLFVVFHNLIFEQLYTEMSEKDKECITMYGVKNRQESEFKTIYEADLPIYNPKLQADIYNEGSAFYHIYKNNLYNDCDYIGFGQYDMKVHSNTLTDIKYTLQNTSTPCIFVMDFFPDIKEGGFRGCHNIIKSDLNGVECALTSYNRLFNKNYTPDDVIQNRLIMCNTFVIHKKTFEKMMSWIINYYKDDINVNRHHLIGNAGELPEALIGMFLSLEVLEGAKYHKFHVEHIWPLYKQISNSTKTVKKGLLLLSGETFRYGNDNMTTDTKSSYAEQIDACKSHVRFINDLKEKHGVDMSIVLSTYSTEFDSDMCDIYKPYLLSSNIYNDPPFGINKLFHDSIKSINNITQYEFVLFVRVDLVLKDEFINRYNPSWKTIHFPSVCWLKDSKIDNHPRVNDMMLHIPSKYYKYIDNMHFKPTGHALWYDLVRDTDITYDDLNTMLDTYHDSNTLRDWNPLYYIANRHRTDIWHSKGHIFKKAPKSLVVYTYFASPSSDYNLNFYSKMAITENARIDYIIVVNGHTCNVVLPSLPNLKVIYRDNVGFDFGGHKAALDSLHGKQYDYYFFMNSGVLGPFLPETHPKDIHWTELFIRKITDKVKLVGTSIYCVPNRHPEYNGPRVEGFCFMTDSIGMKLFLEQKNIFYNNKSKDDTIHYGEYGLTQCIFKQGYTIDCMLKKYQGVNWLDPRNMHYNLGKPPSRKGTYFGKSIDPFEVVFHKWYWSDSDKSMVSFDVVEKYVMNKLNK